MRCVRGLSAVLVENVLSNAEEIGFGTSNGLRPIAAKQPQKDLLDEVRDLRERIAQP